MNCIVAVASNWGIGKSNDLLFRIHEDQTYFRRMTIGKTLILGRKNLESFPGCRPLPKRRHLVLSGNPDWQPSDVEVFRSLAELMEAAADIPEEDLWVVGGGVVYRELLPYCRRAYVTHVDAAPDADVFFPDLSQLPEWELTERGEPLTAEDGLSYCFCVYTNHAVKKLSFNSAITEGES